MPLDFGSPHATKLDLDGVDTSDTLGRPDFINDEIEVTLSRLQEARDGIRATSTSILNFTVDFTKVLILMKDPTNDTYFASGSNGQYVARSFIVNPHAASVDEVDIAESLVHEAIHALLYMQERQQRWVHEADLYDPAPVIVSPWSGNKLAIRSYLQACFVWYGLIHFWTMSLPAGAFRRDRVLSRMTTATRGFLREPLLSHVEPYRKGIGPDIQAALTAMQDGICTSFAAAGVSSAR
jgi:hypothetical protein